MVLPVIAAVVAPVIAVPAGRDVPVTTVPPDAGLGAFARLVADDRDATAEHAPSRAVLAPELDGPVNGDVRIFDDPSAPVGAAVVVVSIVGGLDRAAVPVADAVVPDILAANGIDGLLLAAVEAATEAVVAAGVATIAAVVAVRLELRTNPHFGLRPLIASVVVVIVVVALDPEMRAIAAVRTVVAVVLRRLVS